MLDRMEQTILCTNCGAENPAAARFCRKCGQRSLNQASVTEGTTRLLETLERESPVDPNMQERGGPLAQPTSPIHPQAVPTNRNLEQSKQPKTWLLLGSVLVAILLVSGILIALRYRTTTTTTPPTVMKPDIPPIQPPPLPPLPPPTTGAPPASTINPALIYPGAKTTMSVTDSNEGHSVIQLQTTDAKEKVVAWYKEKIKPTTFVETHKDTANQTILGAAGIQAIISSQGEDTTIMLVQGKDQDED